MLSCLCICLSLLMAFLLFILSRMVCVIQCFLFVLLLVGKLSLRASDIICLNSAQLFSLVSSSTCSPLGSFPNTPYLLRTSILYLSLYSGCLSSSNSSCSLTLTFLKFLNFRFIIILTGIWSELMSAPGVASACLIEFLNLSLIII